MKLSYSWLCDYVDLSGLTPQEVADKLTMGAFEVEEISAEGPDLVGPVVCGEILEISQHPNADKIRLTKVKIKKDSDPLEIVCGAQNIEVGQRIPVALPGAIVLNRKTGEKLEIKLSAIRGVTSNGMLCSPNELGITNGDSEGILILSKPGENGIELGTDIIEHMSLKPEFILHVGARSNRGDGLSVIGLAREVAALVGRPLKMPEWNLAGQTDKVHQDADEKDGFSTRVESTEDCPYFSIRVIENIEIGPSPDWLKRRLESLGLRTVNNVVDITNYVMLELGQPLHAYDMAKMNGKTITTRRAKAGEKLMSLDGKLRELNDEVLAITDAKDIVGLAGIMGGKDSEIEDNTKNIALEAACFNPRRVRRGSRLLGLSSDSSLRFERGVDVQSVKNASDRATYLIAKYCGANVQVKDFYYSGSDKQEPVYVSMRLSQVKRFLDVEISKAEATAILVSLGFKEKQNSDPQVVEVEVPSFRRSDVKREIDLIEEVSRLYGFDKLPEAMPHSTMSARRPDSLMNDVRRSLCAQGLSEAWISSLRGESEFSDLNSPALVKVLNPLSADHQVLRQSLLPGLIEAVKYNQDRGHKDVWLFETGRSYRRVSGSDKDVHGTGVSESTLAAGIISGSLIKSLTNSEKHNDVVRSRPTMQETVDYYRIKGIVENLAEAARVPVENLRFFRAPDSPSVFHPFRVAQIGYVPAAADKSNNGKTSSSESRLIKLGFVGELHPAIVRDKNLKDRAFLFELDLDLLSDCRAKLAFTEPPVTPSVNRDLTADLSIEIDHAAVQSCIEAQAGPALTEIELVSIFQLDDETRSLSYRLTFQDREKTLTNEEIDARLVAVRKALADKLGAKFRA